MSVPEGYGTSMQMAGAGLEATGAYFEAKVNKTLLKSKANMAEINARLTDLSADSALSAGRTAKAKSDLEYGALKSSQKVGMAANMLDLGSVTSQNVLNSTDYLKEVDSDIITGNAAKQAWGLRMDATNQRNEALGYRAEAKGINPFMSAAKSLLGSAQRTAASRGRADAAQNGVARETIPGLPWTTSGSPRPKYMGGGTY
jgi:hypothetical protein